MGSKSRDGWGRRGKGRRGWGYIWDFNFEHLHRGGRHYLRWKAILLGDSPREEVLVVGSHARWKVVSSVV